MEARRAIERAPEVSAVLDGEKTPVFMISSMVDEFERVVAASLVLKSERQRNKWRVPKHTALATFMDVIGGDRPINALTRTDTLAFRSFWQERIVSGEVAIDTANKSIGRISSMYRTINENRQLGLPAFFENLGGKDKQRVAYAPEFVQERILADGVLADLNAEARRVIYLVSEMGLRLSQACNLSRTTIRLNAPVPHVQIRPEGREIKTDQSQRDIPLVGAALMAMREQIPPLSRQGGALSALVNQALEARRLRPHPGQTLYSLRHTFEDRLTAVGRRANQDVLEHLLISVTHDGLYAGDKPRHSARSTHPRPPTNARRTRLKAPQIQALAADDLAIDGGQRCMLFDSGQEGRPDGLSSRV